MKNQKKNHTRPGFPMVFKTQKKSKVGRPRRKRGRWMRKRYRMMNINLELILRGEKHLIREKGQRRRGKETTRIKES